MTIVEEKKKCMYCGKETEGVYSFDIDIKNIYLCGDDLCTTKFMIDSMPGPGYTLEYNDNL